MSRRLSAPSASATYSVSYDVTSPYSTSPLRIRSTFLVDAWLRTAPSTCAHPSQGCRSPVESLLVRPACGDDEHGAVRAAGEQDGVGDRQQRRRIEDDEVSLAEL